MDGTINFLVRMITHWAGMGFSMYKGWPQMYICVGKLESMRSKKTTSREEVGVLSCNWLTSLETLSMELLKQKWLYSIRCFIFFENYPDILKWIWKCVIYLTFGSILAWGKKRCIHNGVQWTTKKTRPLELLGVTFRNRWEHSNRFAFYDRSET